VLLFWLFVAGDLTQHSELSPMCVLLAIWPTRSLVFPVPKY